MFRRERIITQTFATGLVYKFRIYIKTYEYYSVGDDDPTTTTTVTICSDPDITIENPNILDQIKPVTITFDYNGPGYMRYEYLGTQFSTEMTVTADVDYPGKEYILKRVTFTDYDKIMYVNNNDNIRNYLNIYLNPTQDSVFKYDYTLDYVYERDNSKPIIYITPDPGRYQPTSSLLIVTSDYAVNSDITIIVEESNDYYFEEFSPIITKYHTFYAGTYETEISPETYTYVRFYGISPTSDDVYEYRVFE
jgi:hypothetical protein